MKIHLEYLFSFPFNSLKIFINLILRHEIAQKPLALRHNYLRQQQHWLYFYNSEKAFVAGS